MLRHGLPGCRRGIAALEFALVAPVAIVMVIGVYDVTMAAIVQQEVYNAAHLIPVSASSLAVQPDSSTALTVTQVQQSLSGIFAEMPWRRAGLLNGRTAVVMTSVTFTQTSPLCLPGVNLLCNYVPNVAWSVPYADPPGRNVANANSFLAITRPCMTLNETAPGRTTPGDLTSVPTANITTPDPILVVDVYYQYSPMFFSFVTGPINSWASGYWPVRSVALGSAAGSQYTRYDTANAAGGVGKCPGYT